MSEDVGASFMRTVKLGEVDEAPKRLRRRRKAPPKAGCGIFRNWMHKLIYQVTPGPYLKLRWWLMAVRGPDAERSTLHALRPMTEVTSDMPLARASECLTHS